MTIYKCPRCKLTFRFKSKYLIHIDRKKICEVVPEANEEPINNIIDRDNERNKCQYCNKTFTRNTTLKNHMNKICKLKNVQNNVNTDMQGKIDNLEKELMNQKIMFLERENEQLRKGKAVQKVTNNIKEVNIQNIVQNNIIQLNPFGKEDLSHITDDNYIALLNKGFNGIQAALLKIYFDIDKPQNHNIILSNYQNGIIKLFTGERWEIKKDKEQIIDLNDKIFYILQDKCEELIQKNVLDNNIIQKHERFKDSYEDDTTTTKNDNYQETKQTLYNKRNIPIETKRRMTLDAKTII